MKPRTWNIAELIRRKHHRSRLLGILALAAFVLALAMAMRKYWTAESPMVTISAGSSEGVWHRYLIDFAREAGKHGLQIQPVLTGGSIDMLERVNAGQLDFAVVQGGYDIEQYTHVRQVAALAVQPLHLLVKAQIHEAVCRDFHALRGKTINLGSSKRTGTYWLSRELMTFAGMPPLDYHGTDLTSEQIFDINDPDRLPDAIFIVTAPPSDHVIRLVRRFGYRLVPLPFAQAFRATAMHPRDPVPSEGIGVRKEHLPDGLIPAYVYDVSPPVPPQDMATIGSRVLLVTNANTPTRTVVRLLDRLLDSRYAHTIQPPLTAEIVRQPAEAPWHQGALLYRRRAEPLITGELLGILSNAFQLILPIGGGAILFWGWLRTRVLTDRERRIDRFIALVSGVERRALHLAEGGPPDHALIQELHRELSTIKDAALERIARGEAGHPLLVSSLFSHMADVRAFLSSLERKAVDSTGSRPRDL